jgi:hypothetical protein
MILSTLSAVPVALNEGELGIPGRWRERRRLTELDRKAARSAELYLLGELLSDASDLVRAGWVQHCWFAVRDEQGTRRRVGPRNLQDLDGKRVSEVCMVGAIVQAAGGVDQAGTDAVHGAIDLTWATLYSKPIRCCSSPSVRLAYIHDLIAWNDAAGRTADDAATLLSAAALRAHAERVIPADGAEASV